MQSNIDLNSLDVNQVLQLIQATLSGDNERIKLSTRLLKTYTKHKVSIRTLTYILINSPEMGHRQMATVLLKRNLVNLYGSLQVAQKAEFRTLLIQQYAKQPHLLVQRGIATLISILLPIVQIKNWIQLQQLLDQAIQSSPNSTATFVLLNSILYHFKPPAGLYTYLLNALLNETLAEEAIKCVVAVAQTQDIDPSFAVQFIKIWERANWSEEVSIIAVEVLTVMVERKLKLVDDVTVWLCDKIVGNRKASNKLRAAGCDYLFAFAQFSAKQLGSKQQLLKKVVQTVCLTCSQPYHHRQQEQQTGQFVQEIALWLIETLAITIKPKKIYPVLSQAAFNLIKSEDTNQINTGFLVLGAMCEGCGQRVKNNLQNPIMNTLIPRGLSHPAPEVKGAAINALCYFSEHLIPDIFQYHSVIIPALLSHFGDHSTKVAGKALIAIDVFFDGMQQQDIIQYLSISIPRLIEVLGSNHSTPLMKAAAISAIGSAVYVSELKFQPFLQSVLNVCLFLLKLPPSPQLNTIRAQNLNVLGKLANVFCKQEYVNHELFYKTYIMGMMQQVYLLIQSQKESQIKQAAFAFFYLIANAIGNRFQIVFDNLIPIVLASCQPKEDPAKKKQFSLDSDSEDQQQANIIAHKITQQDQKAAAIHALGQFAKACPLKFTPYFQEGYRLLEEHYQHFYQNIRIQVCHCYTNLTLGLVKSQYNGIIPKPQQGLPCVNRYSQALQQHFRTVIVPKLLTVMTEDDDNRVRGAAIESLDDLVKQLGPAFIDRNLNPLKEAIMKLLQADINEDEEQQQQGEQEQDETQVQTFQSLCDLIPTLAENLRAGFQPTLYQLHPYMLKYIEQRQDINDNVQMTGCLSQCFKWVPGYAANYSEQLFRSLAALVQLWETEINRNVAYCFAEMFEKSPYFFTKYLQQGLIILKKIFDHESSSQACKDNALAAICRIIYTINPPMPHQIFVDGLIKMLPFQGDEQEQSSALKAILFLAANNPQVLLPHRESIVRILQNDLSQVKKYNIQEPLIGQLQNLLQKIRG